MKKFINSVVAKFDTTQDGNAAVGTTITVRKNGVGSKAVIYSDNGDTLKENPFAVDSNGNYQFYVEDGRYDIIQNEGLASQISLIDIIISEIVGITTTQLISSATSAREGDLIETTGYSTKGVGGAKWVATSTTGLTPNQSPLTRRAAELTDSLGRLWVMKGDLDLLALGGTEADVTQAYNAAVGALNGGYIGIIKVPAGRYNIDPTLTDALEATTSIVGEGSGVSELITTTAGGVVTELITRNGKYTLTVKDIAYICGAGTTSTAFRVEDTSDGVNGEFDSLVMNNVIVEAEQGSWWRKFISSVNNGGVVLEYVYLRNGGQSVAQRDVNTIGIEILNDNPNALIIRALDSSQIYIQRTNTMLLVDSVNSVESVYLNSGELVGGDYGMRTEGAGKVDAIKIDVHMDCIKRNVLANCDSVGFVKILGDLRISTNGDDIDVDGINLEFNSNVEMLLANGSTSQGSGHTNGRALKFNGNVIRSKIETQIRGFNIGIDMTNANVVFGVTCDPSFSEGITDRYLNVPQEVFFADSQQVNINFSGDLDDLFGEVTAEGPSRLQSNRIVATTTTLPSGVTATGSVIVTSGVDSDTGYQTLYPVNPEMKFTFIRKKQGGIVGAWGRQGADLNGTFINPTSITVSNGIITAIS